MKRNSKNKENNQTSFAKKVKSSQTADKNRCDKALLTNSLNIDTPTISESKLKTVKDECVEMAPQTEKYEKAQVIATNDVVEKDLSNLKHRQEKETACSSKQTIEHVTKVVSKIDDLKRLLKTPDFAGDYFLCGKVDQLPLIPGLFINETNYALPLCQAQVEHFREISTLNTSGYYSISGSMVNMRNPKWVEKLDSFVEIVAAKMGYVQNKCSYKLRSLDLFPPGSVSLRRKVSPKEKGVIANLLIQLPSIHTGGNLRVYSEDSHISREFKFDKQNLNCDIQYAAFDSSLQYDLQEITSGHSLILNYSISSADSIDFAKKKSQMEEMSGVLNELNKAENFTLLLESQYTPESIKEKGVGVLHNLDKHRFNLLNNANALLSRDNQYRLLLAHLTYDIQTDLSFDHGFRPDKYSYGAEYEEENEASKYKADSDDKKYGFVRKNLDYDSDDTDEESVHEYSSSDESDENSDDSETSSSDSENSSNDSGEEGFYPFMRNDEYSAVARYRKSTKREKETEVSREKSIRSLFDTHGSQVSIETNFSFKFLNVIVHPSAKTNVADLEDMTLWGGRQTILINGKRGEDVTKTTRYHKYALVLCPILDEFNSILKADCNMAIDYLHKSIFADNLETGFGSAQHQGNYLN